jgi:hypothetical protein
MKKGAKQQMYSKMYLITPMVYDKIKNHLDKSDLLSLTNINKPYFTPKIEFHGSNPPFNPPFDQTQRPYQDMPTISNLPPPPPPPPPPSSDDPHGDFLRELEEMDWTEYERKPKTEFSTQTDLFPGTSEIFTQTELPPRTSEFSTQTELPPGRSEFGIQTEPPPRTVTFSTQTDPTITAHQQTQSEHFPGIEQGTQTDLSRDVGVQVYPQLKKLIPRSDASTQTTRSKPRKNKTPKKKSDAAPVQVVPVPQEIPIAEPVSDIQPSTSRALVSSATRQVVEIPKKTVSTLKRTPIRVKFTPEFMRENFQRYLFEQRMQQQQQQQQRQQQNFQPSFRELELPIQPQLTYMSQAQPEQAMDSHAVAVPETSYYVQAPTDEPPGQKALKRSLEEEYVPASKIIKKTYSRKKKQDKEKFKPTHIINPPDEEIPADINLPPKKGKKTWPCDMCGAILASKFNLKRHQQRERRRIGAIGGISGSEYTEEPQFTAWNPTFPAKRTSTDAKLRSQTYRKRFSREPQSALEFQSWSEPTDN